MFKHPKCGGQHETVAQARDCETTVKFAAEIEAGHAHFLATGRDEDAEPFTTGDHDTVAAEAWLAGSTEKLRNAHATSPVLANLRSYGPIDKTAVTAHRVDSLMNSGARHGVAECDCPDCLDKPARRENYATPGMEKFVADLIVERETDELTGELAEALMDQLDGKRLYFSQARALITALKTAHKRHDVKAARTEAKQGWRLLAEQVPDGNYAILPADDTDQPKFYRVSRTEAGYFKIQARGGPVLYQLALGTYAEVLTSIIDFGIERAGLLYSERLGRCRKCGLTLTDETNNPYRAAGYGPECGAK